MDRKIFFIDGNNFSNLDEFFDEIERELTKDLDWKIGRNLNAFNDVLRGGFGAFEYEEPITICWQNSDKSEFELELFEDLVQIVKNHKHIAFELR